MKHSKIKKKADAAGAVSAADAEETLQAQAEEYATNIETWEERKDERKKGRKEERKKGRRRRSERGGGKIKGNRMRTGRHVHNAQIEIKWR